jgi:hypothetical protein
MAEIMDICTRTPEIGIFWRVQTAKATPVLLADSVPLDQAERYGDFLTHGGHYEFWSSMAELAASELRRRNLPDVAKWSEYEEWPRGRVVFHVLTNRFTIYADRKLQGAKIIEQIVNRFMLPTDRVDVQGDPHYISVR